MRKSIVMIHGMFCGSWVWSNYKDFFEKKGYSCYCPVLRYHNMNPGDKPDPKLGKTSLLDYAQDLEEFTRKFTHKPLLMGHSMGGLLSQILGSRGVASGLILLTPASPSGINALKYSVVKSFWSILSKWGFWHNPHKIPFKAAEYAMMHMLPEEVRKTTYDKLVYESGKVAAEIGYWYLDSKGAAKVDESKVTCPILVISGSEDRITPASVVKKVANKYKSVSTYKEFQNHAHWVIDEDGWDDIAIFISEWIDEKRNLLS